MCWGTTGFSGWKYSIFSLITRAIKTSNSDRIWLQSSTDGRKVCSGILATSETGASFGRSFPVTRSRTAYIWNQWWSLSFLFIDWWEVRWCRSTLSPMIWYEGYSSNWSSKVYRREEWWTYYFMSIVYHVNALSWCRILTPTWVITTDVILPLQNFLVKSSC